MFPSEIGPLFVLCSTLCFAVENHPLANQCLLERKLSSVSQSVHHIID